MAKIWVTSDLHLMHDKSFLYEPRGFSSPVKHAEEVVKRWNETIDKADTVYILGDIMLCDNKKGMEYFKQLNGFKHIILGNHDSAARIALYESLDNVLSIQYAMPLKYRGYHFYLSHYPCLTSNYDADKPLKARVISLCGHTHTKDSFADFDKGLIYHCEMDTNNCYPWNIDDIIENIKNKVEECKKML